MSAERKPIAVIGTPGRVQASFRKPTRRLFEEVGLNTGNLAFQYAAWSLMADEKRAFPFAFDPTRVAEECRLVCIPAANFLYGGFDLGDLADRVDKTRLPVMVLGLGCQAMRSLDEIRLKEGTRRLLGVLAERSSVIAVRGKFTAQFLEQQGVKNYEVLGCPSGFIEPDANLGKQILQRWSLRQERLGFAPTFYSYNAGFEAEVYRVFEDRIVDIVAQDPYPAVALARGDDEAELDQWTRDAAGFLSMLEPEQRAVARQRLRTYFCAEAWLEATRRLDATVGSRFHGVMMSWQAGRAAMLISYDLRTEELADVMGLPMLKEAEISSQDVAERFDQRLADCAAVYDARRVSLAQRLVTFFEAHGVTASAKLRELARAGSAESKESAAGAFGRVRGFLELYNRDRVAGWVASDQPEPPRVTISLGEHRLGTVTPSKRRLGVGKHGWGFEIRVPPEALTQDVLRVAATVEPTGAHLGNSPVVTSFAPGGEQKVLRGKDGWLFLRNDANATLDQIQGRRLLSDAELDSWRRFFEQCEAQGEAVGARVVFLVAPCKEVVFAEQLPEGVAVSQARPAHQLRDMLANLRLTRTQMVYPVEALRNAKRYLTYPRGDSHWSDYGAHVTVEALVAGSPDAFGDEPYSPPLDFVTAYRNTDLLSKLGGVCVEPMPVFDRMFCVRLVEDNRVVNTGSVRRFASTLKRSTGRLLLVHDSFAEWLIPPLAERFNETLTVWGRALAPDLVRAFEPTAIVIEKAERFLIIPPTTDC